MRYRKEYTGTVYLGVTGADNNPDQCRDTIQNIRTRPGDSLLHFKRYTKGFQARQDHVDEFLKTDHDFILFLDADMYFEPDTLEKLRSHKMPYVSGLYMYRSQNPLAPIWFRPYDGQWPLIPWVGKIPRQKLVPIGASGWGCMLVHRDVILAVRELLKGELEIIEDDMDILPYDLPRLMKGVRALRWFADNDREIPSDITKKIADIFSEEIRPLRADNQVVGSDIRFPVFALMAGYQLVGDPEVRCGHSINYSLHPKDYDQITPAQFDKAEHDLKEGMKVRREHHRDNLRKVGIDG